MAYTDWLFEWLSTGMIGWITNGVVPLAVFALITILLIFASKWFAIKFGTTKQVGKYILRGCTYLSAFALFISIFTFAYGYRGTPVDATHENITLLNPGNYLVVGKIPIDTGHVFTVAPLDDPGNWHKFKQIYCLDWQVKTSIAVNNTICIVGFEKVVLFIDEVEVPVTEEEEGDQTESDAYGMLDPADDNT